MANPTSAPSEFATKADFADLKADIKAERQELRADIASVKADNASVKADIANLKTDLADRETRLAWRLFGVGVAAVTIIIGAVGSMQALGIGGGADPGARNEASATPLHWAARYNTNLSVITKLIRAGADPNARNEDGKVPFDYVKDRETLKGSESYRLLKDGRLK